MEDSERRKVAELLKEIRSETDTKNNETSSEVGRLKWMYKGANDLVDREEYLLGKAIDKSFEVLNSAGTSDICLARTSDQSNVPKRLLEKSDSTEQVDIAKKILEDPLYAIKQKEMEARKKLLNNPVKLKQIKQMLLERNKKSGSDENQKKKKIKKEKLSDEDLHFLILKMLKELTEKEKKKVFKKVLKPKSQKKKSSESSSSADEEPKKPKMSKKLKRKRDLSSENSDSDNSITDSCSSSSSTSSSSNDSTKKVKRKKKKLISKKKSDDSDSSMPEKDKKIKKPKKQRKKPSTSSTSEDLSSSCSDEVKTQKKSKNLEDSKHKYKDKNKSDKGDDNNIKKGHNLIKNSHEEKHKSNKNYGLMMPDGSNPIAKKNSSSVNNYKKKIDSKPAYVPPIKSKPLSEKEKAKKLKEMMEDAKLRKADREKGLASHRKKESKEEEIKPYDDDFVRRQMSHLTSQGTMAERIKSNINNIQRSKSSMNSSFMRK